MSEITYNVKIKFEKQEDCNFWFNLLNTQKDVYNFASKLIFDKKPNTLIKEYHDILYNKIKEKFNISSQTIPCRYRNNFRSAYLRPFPELLGRICRVCPANRRFHHP